MAWICLDHLVVVSHATYPMCPFHSFDLELNICAQGGWRLREARAVEVLIFPFAIHFTFLFGQIPRWKHSAGLGEGALRKEGPRNLLREPTVALHLAPDTR